MGSVLAALSQACSCSSTAGRAAGIARPEVTEAGCCTLPEVTEAAGGRGTFPALYTTAELWTCPPVPHGRQKTAVRPQTASPEEYFKDK